MKIRSHYIGIMVMIWLLIQSLFQISTTNTWISVFLEKNNFYNVTNRVIYRTGGVTIEGYGSYFQRLKSSIIISMFLNKTLIIQDGAVESEHNYSVTLQTNQVYNHGITHIGYMCKLQMHDEVKLLDLMCQHMSKKHMNNSDSASLTRFTKENSCNRIQHVKERETYENFNDCIQPWLSNTFSEMFKSRMYTSYIQSVHNCLNVGIHIGFGDVSKNDTKHLDGRSIQVENVNFIVRNLEETNRCFNYYIFVKNSSKELLSELCLIMKL